ncbi:MAG: hypothetical protein BIFFINMI_01014 [Phycisphaerae bacterium]|nr:hypothetical protein [Phycisphaerae bacterium]
MLTFLLTLFHDPLPVQDFWPWMLVPLAASIAIIYKTLKVPNVRQVPLAALTLTLTILGGMVLAAAVLSAIAHFWVF